MPELWLFTSHRRADAHPFRARIDALAPRLTRLHRVEHYSDEAACGAGSRHLQPDVIAQELIARRARFYLCGPAAMVRAFQQGLVQRGVPAFDVFTEVFRSPADVSSTVEGQPCLVRFARSGGRTLRWTPGCGTLLELGEAAGINLPSGCRVGQCESCAVGLLSGTVAHLHGAGPELGTACLACQAIPVGDVTLDA
jgi:ferredoxin